LLPRLPRADHRQPDWPQAAVLLQPLPRCGAPVAQFRKPTKRKNAGWCVKKPGGYPHGRDPQNGENFPAISNGCKGVFVDRGSAVNGLLRRIVEIEVFAPHAWTEVTSTDGVRSRVARLRP
jgi:hypothetical protein